MINLSEELNNYRIIDPDTLVAKGYIITENVRNSLTLYNKALTNIKQGNEDIAIIELKKSIALNSEFNEAINLLGLCYAATGQEARARKLFEKVILSEQNGALALKYVEKMEKGGAEATIDGVLLSKTAKRHDPNNDIRIAARKKKNISHKSIRRKASFAFADNKSIKKGRTGIRTGIGTLRTFFTILLFVIIISGIVYLFATGKFKFSGSQGGTPKTTLNNATIEPVEDEGSEVDPEEVYSEKINIFYNARDLFNKRSESSAYLYQAADIIYDIKDFEFRDIDKAEFDVFLASVMTEASKTGYEEARTEYNVGNYAKAEELMAKVYYNYGILEYPVWQTYFMGLCHFNTQHYNEAQEVFITVTEKFPDTEYEEWSRYFLDQIEQIKSETPPTPTPASDTADEPENGDAEGDTDDTGVTDNSEDLNQNGGTPGLISATKPVSTPQPTPQPTPSPTPSPTPTATPQPTPSPTPTAMPSPTPTATPVSTTPETTPQATTKPAGEST